MSNVGRTFSNGNASYFRFGNIYILENDQDKTAAYSLSTFSSSNYTTFTGPSGWRTYDASTRPFYVIKMEINTATDVLNYLRVYSSSDESKALLDLQDQQLTDADYTTIGFGYIKSKSVTTTQVEILKSIKVTETAQTVTTADYKVKYVDADGNEIKTAETRTGVVDGAIVLTTADKNAIFNEDKTKKYIYSSDDADEKTVAEDGTTVVTVKFREAATWDYTVNAVYGETTVEIGTGSNFEGEKASVPYNEYINVDGTLYKSSAENSSFKKVFELTENNIVKTVEYTESEISNVVYYSEGEDIEGAGVVNTGNADSRCSGAAAGYSAEGDLKFVTLQPGAYRIAGVVYSPTSAGGNFTIKNGDEEVYNFTSGNTNRAGFMSSVLTITEATDLSIAQGSASAAYDLIYIQKVATDATLSITSAGYATFAPAGNVTIPSGVTAYTVTVNDDNATITLNEISSDAVIPAGTGVLVAGAEGEYTFKGTTADATTLPDNDLKVAGASTVADGSQYGLGNNVDGKVGFYKIKSGDTMAEGKAYLEVSTTDAAKMSFFALSGEITGISTVEAAKADNGAFYTLQGVKVVKPTKGLYINNGKKVIVK